MQQAFTDATPAEQLEARPIGRRREKERQHVPKPLALRRDSRLIRTGGDELAGADQRPLPARIALGETLSNLRRDDFAQVANRGVGGVGMDAIGLLADQLEHLRAYRAEHEGDIRRVDGTGIEEWLQAGEAVVLADIVQRLPGTEAVEDGAHRLQVLAHPGGGRQPARRIAILDVLLDLRAQAQFETPPRHLLQIPACQRDIHRAAREGNQHRGADLDPPGGGQRLAGKQQAIMDSVGYE
ncbi:hypothetical protein D3C78_840350 [compost metagenome]